MNQHETKDKRKTWNLCYGFLILEGEPLDTVKKINDTKPDSSVTMNKIYPGIWILDSQKFIQKIKDCMKKRPRD